MRRLLVLLLTALAAEASFKKAVVSGSGTFLLLQADGALLTFGTCPFGPNSAGQCLYANRPIQVPLPFPAIDIAAADRTAYAVLSNGAVYSWGSDEGFMLGRAAAGLKRPDSNGSPVPAPIAGLPKAIQVSASNAAAGVITESGELWMWGILYGPDQGPQTRAELPQRIPGLPPLQSFSLNSRNTASVIHNLALGRDGSVWAWGANSLGQLGIGNDQSTPTPTKLNLPPAVSIAAGGNNAAAVLADGTVRVWGGNDSSTMANGKNVQFDVNPNPVPVPGITGAVSISAGYGHLIALTKNGTMRTWGHDGWGQAGIGTSGGYQMRPATPKLTGVTAVFATRNRCFATTTGGNLWFWGLGDYKLPGLMRADQKSPVDITALW